MNRFAIFVAGGILTVAVCGVLSTFAPVEPVHAADADYVGNMQCKACHNKKADGAQWDVWKSMKHANAFEVLKSDEAVAAAKELGIDTPPHETAQCLKCHVSGYDAEAEKFHPKLKAADSVQCESCHGPASLHVKDGQAIQFKKVEPGSIDIMANLHTITEETCLCCHNDESPTWDPEKYTMENGEKTGFDFEQAKKIVSHPKPE